MANLCDFEMLVKGSKEGIEHFYKAMSQDGGIWMGRGAEAEISYKEDGAYITGYCKCSIYDAMVTCALSMRKHPEKWFMLNPDNEYLTIFEVCKKFHVNFEAFSEEPGCEFAEHIIYENGREVYETTDFHEEYDENTGEYTSTGGYDLDFCLDDVCDIA